jgi:hypothetical protein
MQGGFSRRACGGDQAAGEVKESAGFGRIREDEVGIASATHSSHTQFDRLLRYEASLEAPSTVRCTSSNVSADVGTSVSAPISVNLLLRFDDAQSSILCKVICHRMM